LGYGGADPSIFTHKHSDALNDGSSLDGSITKIGTLTVDEKLTVFIIIFGGV